MDFTIINYIKLVNCVILKDFSINTFAQFIEKTLPKSLIFRHDVDKLPENSVQFARIQAENNIKGSYYFRIGTESYNEKIILEIAYLGHEIGYHYETMDTCKGNVDKAYNEFCYNLEKFRKLVPISTICMHGSPRSPYDNRDIWKKYNYRNLGIIGEPYFDIDFNKVAYYTDTGRMWDGKKYSVRDKPTIFSSEASAKVGASPTLTNTPLISPFPTYHSTQQIISAIKNNSFPEKAMLTFHPQRWTNQPIPWFKELVLQNTKNMVKKWLVLKTERNFYNNLT